MASKTQCLLCLRMCVCEFTCTAFSSLPTNANCIMDGRTKRDPDDDWKSLRCSRRIGAMCVLFYVFERFVYTVQFCLYVSELCVRNFLSHSLSFSLLRLNNTTTITSLHLGLQLHLHM